MTLRPPIRNLERRFAPFFALLVKQLLWMRDGVGTVISTF